MSEQKWDDGSPVTNDDRRDLAYHALCREIAADLGGTLIGSTPGRGFSMKYKGGSVEIEGTYRQLVEDLHEAKTELTRRLAEVTAERDRLAWTPIGEHPAEWNDGDSYILCIPVQNDRREWNEYHIVTVVADEDTFYFNDSCGNYWDCWSLDDADYYIRLDQLPKPPKAAQRGGEVEDE